MGGTYILITCPFCGRVVKAYVWSLAGTGKLCPSCGALHTWEGTSELSDKPKGYNER